MADTLLQTLRRLNRWVAIAIGIDLHDRHRLESLGKHGQFLDQDRLLPYLCFENLSANTDNIPYVEQFFEHVII